MVWQGDELTKDPHDLCVIDRASEAGYAGPGGSLLRALSLGGLRTWMLHQRLAGQRVGLVRLLSF